MCKKYNVRRAWGASVQGPGHVRQNLPNQDSFLIRHFRWGSVAVVSDGLGSKRFSHIGSKAACTSVVQAVRKARQNTEVDARDFLSLVHAYWLVNIAPLRAADCAATCLFAYVNKDSVLVGRLGDGFVGVLGKNAAPYRLFRDDKGEGFSNSTCSLASRSSLQHWELERLERSNCSAVLLCTDGISEDIAEGSEIAFIQELEETSCKKSNRKNAVESKAWLVDWPTAGHTDDKTLVLLGGI